MTLPPVPDSFYWTDESWGPALRCRPLGVVAPHLFTTRQLQLSFRLRHGRVALRPDKPALARRTAMAVRPGGQAGDDWQLLASALGVTQVVTLGQVHGSQVAVIRHGSALPAARPEADVVISDDPEVAVAIRAADCVPLLLADSRTGVVGAVHAGWRGTAARVAAAAVDAMQREFGSRPGDLVAAIGPSIGACCYEVGSELVDAFAAAGHPRHLVDRWFLASPHAGSEEQDPAHVRKAGPAFWTQGMQRPRLRLDLAGANRDQLILAGVAEQSVHVAGLCTAMHLDLLTSYRAEKEKAGRIAGVIRARP